MTKHYRLRRVLHVIAFVLVVVGLVVATIAIVGEAMSSILGGSFMVALVAYLIGWGASGYWLHVIVRRRLTPADAARAANEHAARAQVMLLAGECAVPWRDKGGAHLCVRAYDHTGPHQCGICEDVAR